MGPALAPSATAAVGTVNQDAVFVTLCESNGVHDADGPAAEARVGRAMTNDLVSGIKVGTKEGAAFGIPTEGCAVVAELLGVWLQTP